MVIQIFIIIISHTILKIKSFTQIHIFISKKSVVFPEVFCLIFNVFYLFFNPFKKRLTP